MVSIFLFIFVYLTAIWIWRFSILYVAHLMNMGKNKAPGPSGITVEMLRHLPDVALDDWLLPLVNHCLLTQTLPESTKHFMVWCIEK